MITDFMKVDLKAIGYHEFCKTVRKSAPDVTFEEGYLDLNDWLGFLAGGHCYHDGDWQGAWGEYMDEIGSENEGSTLPESFIRDWCMKTKVVPLIHFELYCDAQLGVLTFTAAEMCFPFLYSEGDCVWQFSLDGFKENTVTKPVVMEALSWIPDAMLLENADVIKLNREYVKVEDILAAYREAGEPAEALEERLKSGEMPIKSLRPSRRSH